MEIEGSGCPWETEEQNQKNIGDNAISAGADGGETTQDKGRKRVASDNNDDPNSAKISRSQYQRTAVSGDDEIMSNIADQILKRRRLLRSTENKKDTCKVYLYTSPTKFSAPFSRQPLFPPIGPPSLLDQFRSFLRKISNNFVPIQHWHAAFDYDGDDLVVCEAEKILGRLVGSCKIHQKETFIQGHHMKKDFGEHNIPMEVLQKTVESMSVNGDCKITENDCQTWMISLFQKLKLDTEFLEENSARYYRDFALNLWNQITN